MPLTIDEKRGLARLLLRKPHMRGVLADVAASDDILRRLCYEYEKQWNRIEPASEPGDLDHDTKLCIFALLAGEIEDDLDLWLETSQSSTQKVARLGSAR